MELTANTFAVVANLGTVEVTTPPSTIIVSGAIKVCDIFRRLSTVFFPAADFDLKPHSFCTKMSAYRPIFVKPPFPVGMER